MNGTVLTVISDPVLGYIDMLILLVGTAAAVFYLNSVRHRLRHFLLCLGFSVVAGCAMGRALAYIWPVDHTWLVPYLRLGIDTGLALVLLALARGEALRYLRMPPHTFHEDVLELACHAETREEFLMVRTAAAAALAQDGYDRRVRPRNLNPERDNKDLEEEGRPA